MKIYFEQIKQDGLKVDTAFQFDDLTAHIVITEFSGEIYPIKNAYFLDGIVKFHIKDKCDRCAETFQKSFSERIQLELVRNKQEEESEEEEIELTDEDLSYYNINEDYIDLDKIIKEEVILLKPMKWLCSETCKGICPECGASLNNEECTCSKEEIDPRLEVLKKLIK